MVRIRTTQPFRPPPSRPRLRRKEEIPDGVEIDIDGEGAGSAAGQGSGGAKATRKVLRKATEDDIAREEKNREREAEAFTIAQDMITERELPMKLIRVEYSFDASRATFFFFSENRIDFRELVKDLAYKLKSRIEMRQIGVRDVARMIGGFGPCGRELCCSSFLKNFEPVSIRMAKKQEMVLNPAKISGVCGRLLCCLSYEYEMYEANKKDLAGPAADCRQGEERKKRTAGRRGTEGSGGRSARPRRKSARRSGGSSRTQRREKRERSSRTEGAAGTEENSDGKRSRKEKRGRPRQAAATATAAAGRRQPAATATAAADSREQQQQPQAATAAAAAGQEQTGQQPQQQQGAAAAGRGKAGKKKSAGSGARRKRGQGGEGQAPSGPARPAGGQRASNANSPTTGQH